MTNESEAAHTPEVLTRYIAPRARVERGFRSGARLRRDATAAPVLENRVDVVGGRVGVVGVGAPGVHVLVVDGDGVVGDGAGGVVLRVAEGGRHAAHRARAGARAARAAGRRRRTHGLR